MYPTFEKIREIAAGDYKRIPICKELYLSLIHILEEGIFEESGYVDCEWKEILASLEEKYQVVMLLYYSKSLSVKEIAALLEISQNTVPVSYTHLDVYKRQSVY